MNLQRISLDSPRSYPPRVTEFTREFWQALESGEFRTTRCTSCRLLSFPPRAYCPHCWNRNVTWEALSGKGRLYSQTRIHAVPAVFCSEPLPIHVGIVDLDEGLRIAARVIAPEPLPIGSRVEVVTLVHTDGPLIGLKAAGGD